MAEAVGDHQPSGLAKAVFLGRIPWGFRESEWHPFFLKLQLQVVFYPSGKTHVIYHLGSLPIHSPIAILSSFYAMLSHD